MSFLDRWVDRNRWATLLGWYPDCLMAFCTLRLVYSLTELSLFNTRDTVATETLASSATFLRLIVLLI